MVPPPQGQRTADCHAGRLGVSGVPWSHCMALVAHSHPKERAGEWVGREASSGEERNTTAQFYTRKVHNVGDFNKTVPAVSLPEAQCSGGA